MRGVGRTIGLPSGVTAKHQRAEALWKHEVRVRSSDLPAVATRLNYLIVGGLQAGLRSHQNSKSSACLSDMSVLNKIRTFFRENPDAEF
jgi:hypothetical protein